MTSNDLVAFLDILGFENLIKDCVTKNNFDIIKEIDNAMNDAITDANNYGNITPIKVSLNQFSDCTCIWIQDISNDHPDPEKNYLEHIISMLYILRSFQITLLDANIYIRGGLSSGFHHESPNIIFSEGLIKAHELESKKAIYPRIILDKKLANLIKDYYKSHKVILSPSGIDKMLLIDSEGIVFINPFTYYISFKKNPKVYDMLKMSKNPDIKKMLMKKNISQSELEIELKKLDQWYFKDVIEDIKDQIQQYQLKGPRIFERCGWLNEFIKKLMNKFRSPKIFKKYEWIYELFLWTNDPNSSKIKFNYFLK